MTKEGKIITSASILVLVLSVVSVVFSPVIGNWVAVNVFNYESTSWWFNIVCCSFVIGVLVGAYEFFLNLMVNVKNRGTKK